MAKIDGFSHIKSKVFMYQIDGFHVYVHNCGLLTMAVLTMADLEIFH